ncbi:MAG TPA: class I SAM-dependent methyltransferase [Geobacteraceae bacterium]
MIQRLEFWLCHCEGCGFWQSRLGRPDQRLGDESAVVEEHRFAGLKALRAVNNEVILDLIEQFTPLAGMRLLDVGCAYGWFLAAAEQRQAVAVGIEPETAIAEKARQKGLRVKEGYFPGCLDPAESFDVVVFNDVLEHLPGIAQIFDACHAALSKKGRLAVNVPVSSGLFFRLSVLLARLGYKKPLHRLWQKGYRSPHLSYFNARNLEALATRHGFSLLGRRPLKTLARQGLWARLNMDKSVPLPVAIPLYGGLLLLGPVLNALLPADLEVFLFERTD